MKIGILLAGHIPDELQDRHGDYAFMYRNLLGPDAFDYEAHAAVDGALPDSPAACDGWLITGSKHGVYEEHDWLPPLEDFARAAVAERVPIVGICFGHQLLAHALGGRVEKFSGGWSVGLQTYGLEDESGDREASRLMAFHQDQVITPPEGAEVVGSSDFCRNAALRFSETALGIQPHPEFDADFMRDLIAVRREAALPDEVADRALAGLDGPTDAAEIGDRLRAFYRNAG